MENLLYQRRTARTLSLPAPNRALLQGYAPARMAVTLLYGLCQDFGIRPSLFRKEGGRLLTLLFRDVSFSWEDFIQSYGELIACLSDHWPLTVYGTAEDMGVCEILCRREGESVLAEEKNSSGREQSELQDLCLRLLCDTEEAAQTMGEILARVAPFNRALALSKRQEAFCRSQGLLTSTEGSYFAYISLEDPNDCSNYVCCLSMEQKAELWNLFLTYGVCPLEFEWLFRLYEDGGTIHLLEWELALQQALEGLGFSIRNEEGRFTVTDSSHAPRRFDFETGSPAVKIFLKLLFPLNTRLS